MSSQVSQPQKRFRPDIEGLRAVAVVAVVLFHAEVPGIDGGYIGVDVFFVISGFLITGLLWREAHSTGTVRLRSFYGARARRLLPASAVVAIATMIVSAVLLPPLRARTIMGDGITSALYVSNYRFILQDVEYLSPLMAPSPFQHYWSLGVEEQFYLIWPALILGAAWFIRRVRKRTPTEATASRRPYTTVLAVVAALSFAFSLVAIYWAPAAAFFSLPTRAWQLAAGGLVALTADRWVRLSRGVIAFLGWAGLACIVIACFLFGASTLYPGVAALLPTVGTALVIGAGCAAHDQGCGRLLGLGPMRAVGRISYSWYLWHWPVLILAPLLVGHPLGLPARLTAALISCGLAVLTLKVLENPLRFAPSIRGSASRSLLLGGIATAGAACVGAALLVVVPEPVGPGAPATALHLLAQRVPPGATLDEHDAVVQRLFAQVQAAVSTAADVNAVPSNLEPPLADAGAERMYGARNACLLTLWEVHRAGCASDSAAAGTTVAVVGDSAAAMWEPAFRAVADQRQWRLEMLNKAACPVMDLPITNPQLHRRYTECERWRSRTMARLRAEPPALVVVSTTRRYGPDYDLPTPFNSYDAAWINSLAGLVRQLRDSGSKVLVFGPTPNPGSVAPICLSGHLDDATACSPSRSKAVNEAGVAAEAAATRSSGGGYADLIDLFCTAELCPLIVGNTLVYMDQAHLTTEYSGQLAPVIGALADRAVAYG